MLRSWRIFLPDFSGTVRNRCQLLEGGFSWSVTLNVGWGKSIRADRFNSLRCAIRPPLTHVSALPPNAGEDADGQSLKKNIALCVCVLCCAAMCWASLFNSFVDRRHVTSLNIFNQPVFFPLYQNVLQVLIWLRFCKLFPDTYILNHCQHCVKEPAGRVPVNMTGE